MKLRLKNVRMLCLISIMSIASDAMFGQSELPFNMPKVEEPIFPNHTVSIKDFGAVGDGVKMNTDAIRRAINQCAEDGGGTVIIPAGLWITGPIEMRSNINLHIERGALVIFSKNHNDYPLDEKGKSVISPISGEKLNNIAFTGEGVFDGSGDTWRPAKKSKFTDEQWKQMIANGGTIDDQGILWPKGVNPQKDLRTYMVLLTRCTKVLFDGPTFQNSPKFVIVPRYCENLTMRNLKVLNEWSAQNGDGIDVSSGKNIIIKNCMLNVGDDGICMKSSGKSNGTASLQNVIISDCVVYHAHGGFVIGSNTDGGMHNIFVSNCNFMYTDVGLRFKSARDRGGLVDNIFVKNIYMKNIANEAILFDTYYEDKAVGKSTTSPAVTDKTPHFCKFTIENVYCNEANQAIKITGLPEMPIEDVTFNNIKITAKSGITRQYEKNIVMNDVDIITTK
jgi:polygalacturonase